ncbi:MAG: ABC transporter permease, partial [Clostridia bacterium]|nr:ABC transporter permease [Clostridia bacterium]
MKISSKIYSAIILIFLFAPIVVMLFFSFNDAKSLSVFSGFSLRWYEELMGDRNTLESVKNTLILAASATVIS